MSLLEKYDKLKQFKGFTLGYYKFFDSFVFIREVNTMKFRFEFNNVKLAQGFYSYLEAPHWEIPPCICDPNPLALHIGPCKFCGVEPKMADEKIRFQCDFPSRDASFVEELNAFKNAQLDWIKSEEVKKRYRDDRRELKSECQQRINVFVAELHSQFLGKPNINDYQMRGTLDRYLGDIRHFAMMCLKE